jgi:AcrR family transcriptional regulator
VNTSSPDQKPQRRVSLQFDLIVETSRRIVIEEGAEALTLRRVARELGVTAPALYAHVESRRDLLRAVSHAEYEWFTQRDAKHDDLDPLDRLRSYSRDYVRLAQENPHLFRLMVAHPPELFHRDQFEADSTDDSLGHRVFRRRARAIAEAMAQGSLADADPFLVGMIAFTAVHGLANFLLWQPPIDDEFQDRLIEGLIDAVLGGLATGDRRGA